MAACHHGEPSGISARALCKHVAHLVNGHGATRICTPPDKKIAPNLVFIGQRNAIYPAFGRRARESIMPLLDLHAELARG